MRAIRTCGSPAWRAPTCPQYRCCVRWLRCFPRVSRGFEERAAAPRRSGRTGSGLARAGAPDRRSRSRGSARMQARRPGGAARARPCLPGVPPGAQGRARRGAAYGRRLRSRRRSVPSPIRSRADRACTGRAGANVAPAPAWPARLPAGVSTAARTTASQRMLAPSSSPTRHASSRCIRSMIRVAARTLNGISTCAARRDVSISLSSSHAARECPDTKSCPGQSTPCRRSQWTKSSRSSSNTPRSAALVPGR